MNDWKPIATAPLDGTVVLTEEGSCCYVAQAGWGCPVTEGWYLCRPGCQPDLGSNDEVFPLSPRWWMDYPALP